MRTRAFCLLFIFLLLVQLASCGGTAGGENGEAESVKTESAVPTEGQSFRGTAGGFALADGLKIEEVFSYSGAYMEDGSNAACENICAVRIINSSETHYQYLRFSLETPGGVCTFAAVTLFAGARMTVLCEEKTPYKGNEVFSGEVLAVVPFDEPPSVHTDTLEISYADGFINVRNLTEAALTNVYVYYKDTDGYGYLGGITYRASFGEIPAGATVQSGAANMRQATGRVVFATYDS